MKKQGIKRAIKVCTFARLSRDMMAEFPEMKGFSLSNLKYIKQWYLFYIRDNVISQQVVGQITQISWGHNIAIIAKCTSIRQRKGFESFSKTL